MAVQDVSGTFLNLAENAGAANEAAALDVVGDFAKIMLASFSAERLTQLGWVGWLGILPILATSWHVTKYATRRANRRYKK